jgi:cobalt-zinc-cadmium efflux system outer membrane protein
MTALICLGLVAMLATGASHAQVLDREAVLQLARERSPQVLAALDRQDEAAGALTSARVWAHNPELELELTRRSTPDGASRDRAWRLDQRLDLAGRGPRIGAARADLDAAIWQRQDAATAAIAEAMRAWLTALHAGAQSELTAEGAAVQERLHAVAAARYAAGETGALDLALATVARARARAALADSRAVEIDALAELAALLQLESAELPVVSGAMTWPAPPALEVVRAAALAQPSLAALAAAKTAADMRRRSAGALAWPELGLFGGAGSEEDADLRQVGLSVSLPVFSRGQGERRTTAAAARRAELEFEAARRTQLTRVTAAWYRQQELQAAVDTARDETASALDASVRLAETAYTLGEIPLDEALQAQREQLESRRELNDLQLSAALAALDVAYLAALPPLHEGNQP